MRQWSQRVAFSAATAISLFLVGASDARAQATETETSTPASAGASTPWYVSFEVDAFADTYFFWDFNQPKNPQFVYNQNPLHTFAVARGFALNQAGLNVVYPAQPVGVTLSLRFGPGSERYGGNSPVGTVSLEMLKQAFATWAPTEALKIDVGRFDTIYGAEVTESFLNLNYTRGVVWFNQPATHTGVRLGYALSEELSATFLLVNGWNNVLDNNDMKSFGAQVAYAMGDLNLILGTIFGPEQDDNNKTFRVLVDFIANYSTDVFSLVVNGDYLHEGDSSNVGAMLGLGLPLGEMLALGARGEFYRADPGVEGEEVATVLTGTLTFDVKPVDKLLFRAEGRYDNSNQPIFPAKSGTNKKFDVSALISMVVKTN
ncbi:MAG: porin [Deltaproteobacteria bacterium]|nr:porin [Deltaproteobacteria bacterium]